MCFPNLKTLTSFQETLSKFDFTSKYSISQDLMSSMVSSFKFCFKKGHSHILDLVLRPPTNAPHPVANVSKRGERGVGSLKDSGEDKGKVVGR